MHDVLVYVQVSEAFQSNPELFYHCWCYLNVHIDLLLFATNKREDLS